MMRKNITRTLTRTDIHAYSVKMEDGKPAIAELPVVTVWGNVSEDEAIKVVKETHGKNISVTIGQMVQTEECYQIDIDTFVEHAVKIEKATAEN